MSELALYALIALAAALTVLGIWHHYAPDTLPGWARPIGAVAPYLASALVGAVVWAVTLGRRRQTPGGRSDDATDIGGGSEPTTYTDISETIDESDQRLTQEPDDAVFDRLREKLRRRREE